MHCDRCIFSSKQGEGIATGVYSCQKQGEGIAIGVYSRQKQGEGIATGVYSRQNKVKSLRQAYIRAKTR